MDKLSKIWRKNGRRIEENDGKVWETYGKMVEDGGILSRLSEIDLHEEFRGVSAIRFYIQ